MEDKHMHRYVPSQFTTKFAMTAKLNLLGAFAFSHNFITDRLLPVAQSLSRPARGRIARDLPADRMRPDEQRDERQLQRRPTGASTSIFSSSAIDAQNISCLYSRPFGDTLSYETLFLRRSCL
jgi:hypothetical protein